MAETSNLFESEVEQGCMLSVHVWRIKPARPELDGCNQGKSKSSRGSRTSRRWYGVVEDLTHEKIVIRQYPKPTEAIASANPVAMSVDQAELLRERAQLLARVKEIDEQIKALEKETSA